MLKKNEIWKIFGTDYAGMTRALIAAADLDAVIKAKAEEIGAGDPGDIRIGIKPNLVAPSPAQFGATTHPEVVEGIISYLQERKYGNLIIAEGSWVGDRTPEAFLNCGYEELSARYGVPLVDTQKEKAIRKDCAGMELFLTDVTRRVDFWINVPVLKGHCQTKVTCALKNLKGLLPNSEKSRFHRMGLNKPIGHLNAAVRQDFIVVDHICGDLDFEEGGNPVVRNCVMAAADPVLVDAYACRLLQYRKEEVPYIGIAEECGVGSADLTRAEIVLAGMEEGGGPARVIRRWNGGADAEGEEPLRGRKLLDVSYAVWEADSCSACYSSLAGALIRLKEEGLLEKLTTPIGIGQGMRGRGGKLGVGRCTESFEKCIVGCPPSEEKIYGELKEYLLSQP